MKFQFAAFVFVWLALRSFGLSAQTAKSKVLIVDGFSNHDWKQTTKLVRIILEKSNLFEVSASTVPTDTILAEWKNWSPNFSQYDVVIQNTNNWSKPELKWPKAIEQSLEDFVRSGGGLYALHSANNAFLDWDEYNQMIGIGWRPKDNGQAVQVAADGQLILIPESEGKDTYHDARSDQVVRILQDHPINNGFPKAWKTRDMELYKHVRGPAENLTVLSYVTDTTSGINWPVEWVVNYGDGRVYSSTMGHLWEGDVYPLGFRCIGFQTTLIRVVEWLATGKTSYPVPETFPTAEATSLKESELYEYIWQEIVYTGEPLARHEAAFVEAEGKFYLLGGRRIQEISIFDPSTNHWSQGAKPPVEMHHFQGVSYNGKIYVIGALSGEYPHEHPLKNAYVYDTKMDEWSEGFPLPQRRLRGSTTANIYKDKLYISCGITDGHWDGHVSWFDVFDLKNRTWEELPDAPRARDHATASIVDDKLYMIGGRRSSGKVGKVMEFTVPEVDVYDFNSNTWSTLDQRVPTQRAGGTTVAIGNQILFGGGESVSQQKAHSEVEVLDTKHQEWGELPRLIIGRHGTQFIWFNNKLYMASGSGNMGGKPELKSIECFSTGEQ